MAPERPEKTVTFGHVLTFMAIIVIPLLIWGNSVETRFTGAELRISTTISDVVRIDRNMENSNISTNKKLDEIQKALVQILIELQNKQNR